MKRYFKFHLPRPSLKQWLVPGIGGAGAIALVAGLSILADMPLLMAPFGASCVLLFSAPASPLSQPVNVVAGHVVSAAIGLLLAAFLPNDWWAVAIAVGAAITAMAALRVTHPPAGANPLVIFAANPGFSFLVFPVLIGALLLVVFASRFHKAARINYPL
jgi:CBS-domain-containing membrane protein